MSEVPLVMVPDAVGVAAAVESSSSLILEVRFPEEIKDMVWA